MTFGIVVALIGAVLLLAGWLWPYFTERSQPGWLMQAGFGVVLIGAVVFMFSMARGWV